ncbi:MAG: FAD-dependent oxidoreductase [Alphaproteobacteria bacterium]|nr:FAD-dependent oxidoreductase [Alphaproteobacteria bacterium]
MKEINTDICVIGGGAAGLSIASGAAQMGAKVVLFEENKMGGDCLNHGCIPSKTIISSAKTAFQMQKSAKQAIQPIGKPKIDFTEISAHISETIQKIAPHDSVERFEALGVQVFQQRAKFTGKRQISSDTLSVNFKYAVIAIGTHPMIPDIPGLSDVPYFTNESIFSLQTLPEHLVIVGGGAIGVELAQAFIRLGSHVSIIESKTILAHQDGEFKSAIRTILSTEGISFYEQSEIEKITGGNNEITIKTKQKLISGSHLLIATGRKADMHGLELDKAGIITNHGMIKTNARMQTKNPKIYAIGDIATSHRHTNVASAHASIAIQNILFKIPAKFNPLIIPHTIYTDPEISQVGYSKDLAEQKFGAHNIICIIQKISKNDRAVTDSISEGSIQLIAKKNGQLIGATILAPHAGEIIQTCTFAITHKLKLSALAKLHFPYPSYGEALKQAASSFYSERLFSPKMRWLMKWRFKLLP